MTEPNKEVISIVQAAINEWNRQNNLENIRDKVFSKLNQSRDEVLLKLMGFNDRWDQWEIDHCNGRSGNSVIADILYNLHKEALTDWVKENYSPKLTATQKQQIQSAYRASYFEYLRKSVRELAEQKARENAQKIVDQLVKVDDVDAYIQTMTLLLKTNPKTKE